MNQLNARTSSRVRGTSSSRLREKYPPPLLTVPCRCGVASFRRSFEKNRLRRNSSSASHGSASHGREVCVILFWSLLLWPFEQAEATSSSTTRDLNEADAAVDQLNQQIKES